eukprot:scaffold8239_cov170-Skeletonema_dohrnii-CCMP3373.AAC.1
MNSESTLKKKCAAIEYHLVREGVARGEWITALISIMIVLRFTYEAGGVWREENLVCQEDSATSFRRKERVVITRKRRTPL